MRRNLLIFIAITCILSCTAEQDWELPSSYPLIFIDGVDVTVSGATFHARIDNKGDFENVSSYGFCWSRTKGDPEVDKNATQRLSEPFPADKFVVEVTSDLLMGGYTVRAFVIRNGILIYSPPFSFESKGSLMPSITTVSPNPVARGEVLTITGRNFSRLNSSNIVTLNDQKCVVTFSSAEVVKCIVPNSLSPGNYAVRLQSEGTIPTGPQVVEVE